MLENGFFFRSSGSPLPDDWRLESRGAHEDASAKQRARTPLPPRLGMTLRRNAKTYSATLKSKHDHTDRCVWSKGAYCSFICRRIEKMTPPGGEKKNYLRNLLVFQIFYEQRHLLWLLISRKFRTRFIRIFFSTFFLLAFLVTLWRVEMQKSATDFLVFFNFFFIIFFIVLISCTFRFFLLLDVVVDLREI